VILGAVAVVMLGSTAGFVLPPTSVGDPMHKTAAQLCVLSLAGDEGLTWCTRRGNVGELQQKHLLARNLRRAPDADTWVPRGFFVAHDRISAAGDVLTAAVSVACGQGARLSLEEDAFQTHFVVSQAAAELLRWTHLPDDAAAQAAGTLASLQVCIEYLRTRAVSPPLRQRLLALAGSRDESRPGIGCVCAAAESSALREAARVLAALRDRAPELQLELLDRNIWVVKPVTGSMGRGIHFLTSEDLAVAAGEAPERAARGKLSCKEGLGYLVQRCVERPHLLQPRRLAALCPDAAALGGEDGAEDAPEGQRHTMPGRQADAAETDAGHKYNVRFWLEILWSGSRPEAWLYEQGYVELAAVPFTRDLAVPWAHVTNLSPAEGDAQACIECRQWTTETFCRCLGKSPQLPERQLAHELLCRVASLCARALSTIPVAAGGDAGEGARGEQGGPVIGEGAHDGSAGRWKRFGVDFMVDARCHLWLIGGWSLR
jgi:hypothetical protein